MPRESASVAADVRFEEIAGFRVGATSAGLKSSGKPDLGLIAAENPVAAAGVFTSNRVKAAPVLLSKRHLARNRGRARAVLVNAGNANACTGARGMRDARDCCRLVAEAIGAPPGEVLVCSTGVIGHPLDMPRMSAGIARVGKFPGRPGAFARAIMTTDLKPKSAGTRVAGLEGARLAGVCKGSGMIAPNLATMLAFVLTDAPVSPAALRHALRASVAVTFNRVTVDGDTSTNDTVLILASGRRAGASINRPAGRRYRLFAAALQEICMSLATRIAADGEGATKLVRVRVTGARSERDALRAARTVSESPLVKTAMFGNDPNWGRVLAALGRSGAGLRPERVRLTLCGVELFAGGLPRSFDAASVARAMRAREVELAVDLGQGRGEAVMLTCDFSYDYVRINAEYHT